MCIEIKAFCSSEFCAKRRVNIKRGKYVYKWETAREKMVEKEVTDNGMCPDCGHALFHQRSNGNEKYRKRLKI